MIHRTAGGGGWGDPLERDPARVLHDVQEEYVSRQAATDDYGVVLTTDGLSVDAAATTDLRARLRRERGSEGLTPNG